MVVFTSCELRTLAKVSCKRLTKWWYLQGLAGEGRHQLAVKGLQNGGNYKGKFYATLL